jgi:hypothetical protein
VHSQHTKPATIAMDQHTGSVDRDDFVQAAIREVLARVDLEEKAEELEVSQGDEQAALRQQGRTFQCLMCASHPGHRMVVGWPSVR